MPWRRLNLPDRLPHLLGDRRPDQHQRRVPAVPDGRHRGEHHHRGLGRHDSLAGGHRPRILHHLDLAMGGNYPNGIGNSTPTATAIATGAVKGINGLCLANQNSLNTASNPIVVSACNGSPGQQWSPYTDNTLRVQGGCLDVVSAGTTSGTNVDWYPCNGTAAQNWSHQANGELVNPNSGLCLTDPGGNTSARLDIETCTVSAQQQWTLPSGGGSGNTVTVTSPGNQNSTAGTPASVQIHASDSASGQTLTYGATGLPAERVLVEIGDSALPKAPLAGGSQGTASWGSAVVKACEALLKHGTEGTADTTDDVRAGSGFARDAFGAQFAEVRVDTGTGEVRVPRLLGVFAAGHIIDETLARSQLIGGMTMGVGMALMEETVVDEEAGDFLNHDLAQYHVATCADIQDVAAVWIDEEDPYLNPMGAKGIGEIGIVGTAAAI